MTMTNAGGADYELVLKDDLTNELKSVLGNATAAIKATKSAIESQLRDIGTQVASVGKSLASVGVGAAAVGSASLFGFGQAVRAAGDFAETLNMFEAVFKDQTNAVRAWAKEYQSSVGRSESQLLNFLAQAQDTFIPLGFDRREAAELSKTVTKLAIDLGSFKNIADEEALQRIIGGLVGNTENLKAFGVQANDAAIKAKALSLGFDPKNLTGYQKAMAILQITIEGTRDAQGDAVKTASGFVNSVKALKAEIGRLNIALGAGLKDAVTAVIRAMTSLLSGVNDLLEKFPILSRIGAAFALALTGIGVAAVSAGLAIKSLGGTFATLGIVALAPLIKTHGVMGALAVVTGSVRLALDRVTASAVAQATAFRLSAVSTVTLKGALASLARSIVAVGAAFGTMFKAGAIRVAIAGLVSGFKTAIAAITTGFAVMFKFILAGAARLAVALTNPWVALATAIAAAIKLAEMYYKRQEEEAKKRGIGLEQERQRIVAQSFRDAGQAVPSDLSKTFDPNNARVVNQQTGALSQADRDLAEEIKGMRTALETFQEKITGGQRLLDRGTINQSQFDRFAKQELDSFRKSDPVTQRRSELAEQLMTPIEQFQAAVTEAKEVFRGDPEMIKRATEAAAEQFRATDRATQLAEQLMTPMEQFQAAVEEARTVFANSPEYMRRAIKAAADVLKEASGFNARKEEQQRNQKQRQNRADQIADAIKPAGFKIAEQLVEAFNLVKENLLSPDQFRDFAAKLKADQLGSATDVELSRNLATQNAAVASRIGAFAPTFTDQDKLNEYAKEQRDLQKEIRDGINELTKKKDVFGR